MQVLAILGSRNPKGQTARAAGALIDGVKSLAGGTDLVFLPEAKIERCRQCDESGWGICRSEGHCVIEDDFAGVVAKLKKADAAVFATPVYFGDLSESIRAFLDRLRRITMHEAGSERITGKPAIGICVAGGGGGGAPSCVLSLETHLGKGGFDVVDMIPVRRQNLSMKLEVLKTTGKWLASGPEVVHADRVNRVASRPVELRSRAPCDLDGDTAAIAQRIDECLAAVAAPNKGAQRNHAYKSDAYERTH